MKTKKITSLILITVLGTIFTGCAHKEPKPVSVSTDKYHSPRIKSYKKNNYPILKQNNLGQRAVVNMGVVLKTKILNYKDRHDNLIATHDVFYWAKKPDFITTNTLPKRRIRLDSADLPINLNLKGVVDLRKTTSQEKIRMRNNNKDDKKILEFLKREMKKGK